MVTLPAFVDQLLEQGQDPGEVPEIAVTDATGWLAPLITRLLSLVEHGTTDAPSGAFLANGYAHLPIPASDGRGIYLRLANRSVMTPWSVTRTSVILTLAGSVDLDMYLQSEDVKAGRPHYARSFGPEEFMAVHPGTLCALRSSPDGMQILAVKKREHVPMTLTFNEHAAVVQRARWMLQGIVGVGMGGAR